ncbi:MAG: haloacid dehalogenase [Nitrospinaceae bacterium]|nr:MAG: haloacid dehalogenase [Nitrospinaceae bacterium]
MDTDQPANTPWHTKEIPALLAELAATEKGLTLEEADKRLKTHGPNKLPRKPPPTLWQLLGRQFKSALIYILGLAALVSFLLGDFTDAFFIAAVLVLNALIGGIQEWRAEQSAQALQKLLQIRATVERDGSIQEIDAENVVPGDVIWLESGNRVPADIRILMAHGLEVDESLLTGESFGVLKDPLWSGKSETPMADRRNIVHAASTVIRGRGKGVVVATGMKTAIGQLAKDVMSAGGGKPPLIIRMEQFSHMVAIAVLVASAALVLIGIFGHGQGLKEMFMFGVAMAVSAIPEGLPVAMTVALAVGSSRMAARGVIIRQLAAVEGLGSCTFIASDKTGTLTCNELTVREIQLAQGETFKVTGEGFVPEGQILFQDLPANPAQHPILEDLVRAAVLCNEADLYHREETWVWRGDPTDIALLSLGYKLNGTPHTALEQFPQVNQIPFEPEHQFSASYHQVDGETLAFVKGAPERIISMCAIPKNGELSERLLNAAENMAQQGYRVLAFAQRKIAEQMIPSQVPSEPSDLEFLGFVGMIDPLRPGVREAVAACAASGIEVCMITGDHPKTALAIAQGLGLASNPDQVVTGSELIGKSDEELQKIVQYARVFARVAPDQKLSLVNALRNSGHFVAVTGDGINDAPALRAANIGVAMGKSGTDVAREAAELVISDDNFATIINGIEEGRVTYDNIRKVIYLLISTGAAEIVMITLAVILGVPLPLLPVQLLWLNLITNGIQDVALAFEPSESDVLKRPPRPPKEPIFNRLMIERTVIAALVMGLVGFFFYMHLLRLGWSESSARNALLLLMVLFQNVHIANCRSETKSAFSISIFSSPILFYGVITAFSIHVLTMHLPWGQKVLRTEPVDLSTWLMALGCAFSILVIMEIHKRFWNHYHPHTKNKKNLDGEPIDH